MHAVSFTIDSFELKYQQYKGLYFIFQIVINIITAKSPHLRTL